MVTYTGQTSGGGRYIGDNSHHQQGVGYNSAQTTNQDLGAIAPFSIGFSTVLRAAVAGLATAAGGGDPGAIIGSGIVSGLQGGGNALRVLYESGKVDDRQRITYGRQKEDEDWWFVMSIGLVILIFIICVSVPVVYFWSEDKRRKEREQVLGDTDSDSDGEASAV